MNSKTNKIISATYTSEYLYAVPIDWEIEDIIIKYGNLYYKQEEQNVKKEEYEPDWKYPNQIEDTDLDLEDYFECEEASEEEEERYCDNEDCPYGGYCYDEVKEKFKGKPYICVGCSTGKGLQEQEEEEVYCLCPHCDAEGKTLVSKERAKELKENQELELVCPFGDKCEAKQEEESSEEEERKLMSKEDK